MRLKLPQPIRFGAPAAVLILAGHLGPVAWATPTPPPDALGEVLPILQAGYVDYPSLKITGSDHLADVIARSNGKISVGPDTASGPIFTAMLPDNVVYWRLASFAPARTWSDLAKELAAWNRQSSDGMVLDLRSNETPDDLAGAAQVAGFFAPSGATLFVAKKDNATGNRSYVNPRPGDPFTMPMVVLTNAETIGAAEALATYLQSRGALIIGRATAGDGAVFDQKKLASGQLLRFAATPIYLGDGTEVWAHPVNPDLPLTINDKTEQNALVLIGQHDVNDVVQEPVMRKRLSEAALVQGQDPELDEFLASREKGTHLQLSPAAFVQDIALIRALDSLKAIRLSQRTVEAPKVDPALAPITIQ